MIDRIRLVRAKLGADGPPWTRTGDRTDFTTVTLPAAAADRVRDLLIAERAQTVVEVGLAYASSALAIGEALAHRPAQPRHVVIDPFQTSVYQLVGWNLLGEAGLHATTRLIEQPSSLALAALMTEGFTADAAFVDGSHRYHEVFVDMYYLRHVVRPGGLILLDDYDKPPVRTAARYYETNLGWVALEDFGRCRAYRLPPEVTEPSFEDFRPF